MSQLEDLGTNHWTVGDEVVVEFPTGSGSYKAGLVKEIADLLVVSSSPCFLMSQYLQIATKSGTDKRFEFSNATCDVESGAVMNPREFVLDTGSAGQPTGGGLPGIYFEYKGSKLECCDWVIVPSQLSVN